MQELVALRNIHDTVGTVAEGQTFLAHAADVARLLESGAARHVGTRVVWSELAWPDAEVVIIASGPSLTEDDCERMRQWRVQDALRKVIVINTSYRLAPWADVLYACDDRWWEVYYEVVLKEFDGQLWSQDTKSSARFPKVRYVRSESGQGLNQKVGVINQGANSGYQTIGLAYQTGARRVILLGFDMKDGPKNELHWHADHPGKLHSFPQYAVWVSAMERFALDLRKAGMVVVNASRSTALECFPRMPLEEALR